VGIKPNRTYTGEVQPGSCFITSQLGTVGFQVQLECEDGDCSRTIWITENSKKQAEREFTEVLGVKKENLTNATYVENQLAIDIIGRKVEFPTEEQEYPAGSGKVKTVIRWLNKPSASGAAGLSPARAAAVLFGAKPPLRMEDFPSTVSDDDIPF